MSNWSYKLKGKSIAKNLLLAYPVMVLPCPIFLMVSLMWFILCSTSGSHSALPILGFTCHFKRLLSAAWHYFVILCVHEYWACLLLVFLLGLFFPNPVNFLVSSGSLSPPSSLRSRGVFVAFIYFTSYRAFQSTYRGWPLFFCFS